VGWKEVGLLTLLARDGDADIDFMRRLKCHFADPFTPTRAATADEIVKMVQSGVLVPDSSVTYDRYGLDETEQRRLEQDKVTYEAKQLRKQQQQQQMEAAAAARANAQAGRGGPNAGNQAQKSPPKSSSGSAE